MQLLYCEKNIVLQTQKAYIHILITNRVYYQKKMVTFIVRKCEFVFGFSLPSSLCGCDHMENKLQSYIESHVHGLKLLQVFFHNNE